MEAIKGWFVMEINALQNTKISDAIAFAIKWGIIIYGITSIIKVIAPNGFI